MFFFFGTVTLLWTIMALWSPKPGISSFLAIRFGLFVKNRANMFLSLVLKSMIWFSPSSLIVSKNCKFTLMSILHDSVSQFMSGRFMSLRCNILRSTPSAIQHNFLQQLLINVAFVVSLPLPSLFLSLSLSLSLFLSALYLYLLYIHFLAIMWLSDQSNSKKKKLNIQFPLSHIVV